MKRREFLANSSAMMFLPAFQSLDGFVDQKLTPKNVEEICDELLPFENKMKPGEEGCGQFGCVEDYEFLLSDLKKEGINTVSQFRDHIKNYLHIALKKDKESVAKEIKYDRYSKRLNRGVYYIHVGLVRTTLSRY